MTTPIKLDQSTECLKPPFVAFAADCLAEPAVRRYLYQLQVTHNLSINVLLYSIWAALIEQRRLRYLDISRLETAIQIWRQHIIQRLVKLVQRLKTYALTAPPHCRTMILDVQGWVEVEIREANQVEQVLLVTALGLNGSLKKQLRSKEQCLKDLCHNIVQYYKFKQLSLNDSSAKELTELLALLTVDYSTREIWENLEQSVWQLGLSKRHSQRLPLDDC